MDTRFMPLVDTMAKTLVLAETDLDNPVAVETVLREERYGLGAIFAFGDQARQRARELRALVTVAGLIALPAAGHAHETETLVASTSGLIGVAILSTLAGIVIGFGLGLMHDR